MDSNEVWKIKLNYNNWVDFGSLFDWKLKSFQSDSFAIYDVGKEAITITRKAKQDILNRLCEND